MWTFNRPNTRFVTASFIIAIAMTLGCTEEEEAETPDPPEQFAFVDAEDEDSGASCDAVGECEPTPMTMCSLVRLGEVMAFVTLDDRVEYEHECEDRPFRFNHAVNDITITGVVAGNSDFSSVDKVYSTANNHLEAGKTYILRANELNGKWWTMASMEIEPGGVQTTDTSGVYQNIPTTFDEFVNEATTTWYDYEDLCDADAPRLLDDDRFADYIYGEDPICADDGNDDSGPTNPGNNAEPDFPGGNNQEEPDGVGLDD